MIYTLIESPVGALLATADLAHGPITSLHTNAEHRPIDSSWERDDDGFTQLREELAEYFAGTRRDFDVALAGAGTDFQRTVWAALRTIDYGHTATYGEIANQIGSPTASRAVGAANGRNPISIIVPCHRVIGADGTLTGYAGGLAIKRELLDLERRHAGLPNGPDVEPALF